MYCPRCGNKNNDLNLWCTRCGCRLIEAHKENSVNLDVSENYTQPSATNGQKPKEIKDFMIWSIVAAVLGSIIFGIVAVIYSGLTKSELAAQNFDKAKEYSNMARLFCLISLAIWIVKVIFIVLLLIFMIFVASMPFYLY